MLPSINRGLSYPELEDIRRQTKPPLSEQWNDFLKELNNNWWGADMTKTMAALYLKNKEIGSMVVYAPADTYQHVLYTCSVVTKKRGVVDFDVLQVNVKHFAVVTRRSTTTTKEDDYELGRSVLLVNTLHIILNNGVAQLASEDVEAGLVGTPYLCQMIPRPLTTYSRSVSEMATSELEMFMFSLYEKGLWWGLLPNADNRLQCSLLKKHLTSYDKSDSQQRHMVQTNEKKKRSSGIVCMMPLKHTDHGCLFHVLYARTKLVTVYLGTSGASFNITECLHNRTRSNAKVRRYQLKPGNLQWFLDTKLKIDFVPHDPSVVLLSRTNEGFGSCRRAYTRKQKNNTESDDDIAADEAVLKRIRCYTNSDI